MNKVSKKIQVYGAALLLLGAIGTAGAAVMTYDYVVTGDVLSGNEVAANAYNLAGGDIITAFGTFTADLSGGTSVSFATGSGNSMTIDLNRPERNPALSQQR